MSLPRMRANKCLPSKSCVASGSLRRNGVGAHEAAHPLGGGRRGRRVGVETRGHTWRRRRLVWEWGRVRPVRRSSSFSRQAGWDRTPPSRARLPRSSRWRSSERRATSPPSTSGRFVRADGNGGGGFASRCERALRERCSCPVSLLDGPHSSSGAQSLFALWSEADAGSLDVLAVRSRHAASARPPAPHTSRSNDILPFCSPSVPCVPAAGRATPGGRSAAARPHDPCGSRLLRLPAPEPGVRDVRGRQGRLLGLAHLRAHQRRRELRRHRLHLRRALARPVSSPSPPPPVPPSFTRKLCPLSFHSAHARHSRSLHPGARASRSRVVSSTSPSVRARCPRPRRVSTPTPTPLAPRTRLRRRGRDCCSRSPWAPAAPRPRPCCRR